jgi:hypothetical protein
MRRVALAAGAIGRVHGHARRCGRRVRRPEPVARGTAAPLYRRGVLIGTVAVVAAWRTNAADGAGAVPDSPLNLGAALQMTALFQIVLFLILLQRKRDGALRR